MATFKFCVNDVMTHIDGVDPLTHRQEGTLVGDVIEEHDAVSATKVAPRHRPESLLTCDAKSWFARRDSNLGS